MPFLSRAVMVAGAAALAIGGLGACTSDSGDTADECPLTVSDQWVKAQDTGMTGAFGAVANPSDADVTITSLTSPAAGRMEIHEVVEQDGEMVMQPKAGGLVVPAEGSAMLAPGGDHFMLMALPAPILAGDEVEITAVCSTGGSITWTSVAKPFEGGAESYVPMDGDAMPSPSS